MSAELQPEMPWLRPENAEHVRAANLANELYEHTAAANQAAQAVRPLAFRVHCALDQSVLSLKTVKRFRMTTALRRCGRCKRGHRSSPQ